MNLHSYRTKQKLSQAELGRLIGVTDVSVSRYEAGLVVPEPKTMRRIIEATQGAVTANDFFDIPTEAAE